MVSSNSEKHHQCNGKTYCQYIASWTKKILHWHGCFMERCHYIRNCKKTESVIRM